MKSGVSRKEVGFVAAVVLLNAAVLMQIVGSPADRFAFAQPYEDGVACITPSECTSGFCTDGVCCNQQCTGPGQSCDVPGQAGTCVSPHQSPVLSLPLQWIAAGLVALIAALRLRRRLQ